MMFHSILSYFTTNKILMISEAKGKSVSLEMTTDTLILADSFLLVSSFFSINMLHSPLHLYFVLIYPWLDFFASKAKQQTYNEFSIFSFPVFLVRHLDNFDVIHCSFCNYSSASCSLTIYDYLGKKSLIR